MEELDFFPNLTHYHSLKKKKKNSIIWGKKNNIYNKISSHKIAQFLSYYCKFGIFDGKY